MLDFNLGTDTGTWAGVWFLYIQALLEEDLKAIKHFVCVCFLGPYALSIDSGGRHQVQEDLWRSPLRLNLDTFLEASEELKSHQRS